MGESFSNQLSTGTASYSVPISIPGARGSADASLSLTYSTSGGHGIAGAGWDLAVPYIARQTDRGNPGYKDPAGAWTPSQDRFVFNGGQELVPICLVSGTSCSGGQAQPGEVMPSWANGWQYFRPRVEGSFVRIFWSPDHRTWRVQDKNGGSMEIGAPLDGTTATGTMETDPANPGHIFRWNLSRQYDAYGGANPAAGATPLPVNVTRYRYVVDSGLSYLSDVYETPPAANAATADATTYAHHVHLNYETRPDTTMSYRRGWLTTQRLRLTRIEIASVPFQAAPGTPRRLVRRYDLAYDPNYHVSLLTSVQVEGRCGAPGAGEMGEPVAEDGDGLLPSTTCPTLPAMTFGYTHVTPYHSDGSKGVADLAGYEGFDERVTTMVASPPHSVDEAYTDLFDVNADGLPDVVVTMPGLYGGKHGLYLNGVSGQADTFSASTMGVEGVVGEDATTISLNNLNVSVGDLDGDGIIDLMHMPQVKTYSVYTPERLGSSWVWQGRPVTTAAAQSPKINLGNDGLDVQRMDVDGDGLVDVVVSTGTQMETFFSLGRYPGGDGQFGYASWTSGTSAIISNDPVASCVPWDGLPIQLSDSTIKIADMNGDGLPDIVRMQQGDVHYWPGRGDGVWGTGVAASCKAGGFGEGQSIAMEASPHFADPNGSALRLDDVNGDGLDDLVEVNMTDVGVWLNVDGIGWTARHVITNAPASPAFQNRVRLVDVNGSGTRDVLWGDAGAYRYMDLSGGSRPWLLSRVENGLGKTTDLTYASSTSLMLADAAANHPWTSFAPMPLHVVTQMTVSDNLPVARAPAGVYVTQYSYRDPVYDGRQREFRGFTTARERKVGDANSPSSTTESEFLLGTCQDDEALGGLPSACAPAGRWRDNRREALKGLPVSAQAFDDSGRYQSTVHNTYRLRKLYDGLDGREVRLSFNVATDTYLYDVASGDTSVSTLTTDDVELELAPPPFSTSEWVSPPVTIPAQQSGALVLHGASGRAHLQTHVDIDVFGNTYRTADEGCIEGCPVVDPSKTTDEVITQYAQPSEVSNGVTGWTWRPTQKATYGSNDAYGRNEADLAYDTTGALTWTFNYVQGGLPLVRSRADGGAVAPAPPTATKDGWVIPLQTTYDAFGNAVSSVGANSRCTSTTFDPTYADLPVSNTVYVGTAGGNGCGSTPLTASASYDRGLGAVASLTDIHLEQTNVEMDGFGRIVAMFRPLPDTGAAATVPSMKVEYILPADSHATPWSRVHTYVQDGADPTVASYRESWAYVDGLGRARVTLDQADVSAGDGAPWVAGGVTTYDAKGAAQLAYQPFFYGGDPAGYALSSTPGAAFGRAQYDAFGRALVTYALDGAVSLENFYHALSVDAWDAADLAPGPHEGSYATSVKDGHGRAVAVLERNHVQGVLETYQTATTFLSTGEPAVITRSKLGTATPPVVRWMKYDSVGRMVANVEPDTSVGFNANPGASVDAIKAWRYAYDDAGELVGTSDARGCGANYGYDAGGRIVGEDYSPCTADHATYTPVSGTSGYEVLYQYDTADPATANGIGGVAFNPAWYRRRLGAVSDRAGKSVTGYDGRGRSVALARQIMGPNGALAPRWYVQTNSYDAADRVLVERTAAVDSGAAADVTSTVSTSFTKRGLVKQVQSDHGAVIASVTHDADALPLTIVYGDVAGTTTAMSYDARRRLSSVQTYRGPPAIWSAPPANYVPAPAYGGPPSTLQLLLQDLDYQYDAVDNPVEIDDSRDPSEWPAGAQPVTRKMQYDDLYRLTRIDYQYAGGKDPWTSPFAAEDSGIDADPKRANPSPHVNFASRMLWQTFAYDWLGNTTATGDDAAGFYDRSIGAITNGTTAAGPYQLKAATGSTGNLSAAYDAAGNMTGLAVMRSGACLPAGAVCSQRYAYDWDEVGRLARARRWDLTSPGAASDAVPEGAAAADLRYTYDATDDRAIKAAYDAAGNVRYAVYPLDALELRGAEWDAAAEDYQRSTATQLAYAFAHGVRLGRVAKAEADEPSLTSGQSHLFLELQDHLGSTAVVIDRETGELVEEGAYQAYGGSESDYRPKRWGQYREEYRFTGKEDDSDVSLTYFGERYYVSAFGRWGSADPLAIHRPGRADPNLYAYVAGKVIRATDVRGLDTTTPSQCDGGGCENDGFVRLVFRVVLPVLAALTNGGEAGEGSKPEWSYGKTAIEGAAWVSGGRAAELLVKSAGWTFGKAALETTAKVGGSIASQSTEITSVATNATARVEDMSSLAARARSVMGIEKNYSVNIAVFEIKSGESYYYVAARSIRANPKGAYPPGTYFAHSERVADKMITENLGVDPRSVSRIFTERAPCANPGAMCSKLLAEKYPGVQVSSLTNETGEKAELEIGSHYESMASPPKEGP